MCVVSNIYDYGRTVPPNDWTLPAIRDYRILIDQGKKLDADMGQPDCEDPEKEAFMEDLDTIELVLAIKEFLAWFEGFTANKDRLELADLDSINERAGRIRELIA